MKLTKDYYIENQVFKAGTEITINEETMNQDEIQEIKSAPDPDLMKSIRYCVKREGIQDFAENFAMSLWQVLKQEFNGTITIDDFLSPFYNEVEYLKDKF